MREYLNESAATRFVFPIDGDCLNDRDGIATEDGVTVTVLVASAPNATLTVNGIPTREENGIYRATLTVPTGRTRLLAKNETDGTTAAIEVFFFARCDEKISHFFRR